MMSGRSAFSIISTAARACVEAAAPQPVISFGARHVHPAVTDVLDYAAIVGGCASAVAQNFPERPLRMIVPFSPGGGIWWRMTTGSTGT